MFKHRLATSEDISDIQVLMDLSIKKLLGKILNENQLEASYESMGLDNQLIKDRTYFLIFKNNLLVGSGVIVTGGHYLEEIIHLTVLMKCFYLEKMQQK